ncbi:HD domain-containing protein [Sporomusa aerivorans]|uniref:HD domain-containing protein n=1 Tax=Sporomusa aerivorans TaxID=204936 RepID=UPI00352ACEE9
MAELAYLYEWFRQYARSYYTEDALVMEGVRIKEIHSQRVAASALKLAEHLQLTGRQKTIAEVIGLFHDIARFRQITEYRTFVDAQSFDHGDRGVTELAKTNILTNFTREEQETINFAVTAHNKMIIPPANANKELFAQIIRDTDKLDIFRVLPPIQAGHDYSPKLVKQLQQGKLLSYNDVNTLADKRLIRLSWYYNIYFDWTLRQLVDEGHHLRLLAALPATEEFQIIAGTLERYLATRLQK